ncbi:GH25 family lysozyme [Anaerovoracaceae bacterium SGI.195]
MKKKTLFFLVVILAIFLISLMSVNADSDESRWVEGNGKWYYFDTNIGKYVKGDWRKIDNSWYYFDKDTGVMLSNQKSAISGKNYYYDSSGAMITGWHKTNDEWEYFDSSSGAQVVGGWKKIGNAWYYFDFASKYMVHDDVININGEKYCFDKSGAMITGWLKTNDEWEYFDPSSGAQVVGGWKQIGSTWYYFDFVSEYMVHDDIIKINGQKYRFDESGAMITGWLETNGEWEYFDPSSGAQVVGGWKQIGTIWYYFDFISEYMVYDDIINIDGEKYCFDESGAMITGWKHHNKWYYFSSDGSMVRNNWKKIDGVWYFFENISGEMLSDVHRELDGKKYYFSDTGAMHIGWLSVGDDLYYYDSSGAQKYGGWLSYNGKWFLFDEKTGKMLKNIKKIVGDKEYTFNASGEMTSENVMEGWLEIDGHWKYLRNKKEIKNEWIEWGNKWYYFDSHGNMATGWITYKNDYYYLASNGIMQTGWLNYNGATYYLKPSGQMVTGHCDINNRRYFFNESGALSSITVIDISQFNGYIDWNKVRNDGIDGVILRASGRGAESGKIYYDAKFHENAKNATLNNIPIGVYHFSQAINEEEAREEARILINESKNYKISLPYVIDMEYYFEDNFQGRNFKITKEQRTDVVLAFFDEMKKTGKKPLLYASTSFLLNDLDIHRLRNLDIWVAQYYYKNTYPFSKIGWQYTSKGYVAGINGRVDMNVWYKDF